MHPFYNSIMTLNVGPTETELRNIALETTHKYSNHNSACLTLIDRKHILYDQDDHFCVYCMLELAIACICKNVANVIYCGDFKFMCGTCVCIVL